MQMAAAHSSSAYVRTFSPKDRQKSLSVGMKEELLTLNANYPEGKETGPGASFILNGFVTMSNVSSGSIPSSPSNADLDFSCT